MAWTNFNFITWIYLALHQKLGWITLNFHAWRGYISCQALSVIPPPSGQGWHKYSLAATININTFEWPINKLTFQNVFHKAKIILSFGIISTLAFIGRFRHSYAKALWVGRSEVVGYSNDFILDLACPQYWCQFSCCFMYREKMCVYDKHPEASRDRQYRATDSRSRDTTPFDDILK